MLTGAAQAFLVQTRPVAAHDSVFHMRSGADQALLVQTRSGAAGILFSR